MDLPITNNNSAQRPDVIHEVAGRFTVQIKEPIGWEGLRA